MGYGENDTIKYMLRKRFEFDPEASGGLTEDDEITVIHLSYLVRNTFLEIYFLYFY